MDACLHPVELLDGVGIGLGMPLLEGLPLGPLHECRGGADQQHDQQDLHGVWLKKKWLAVGFINCQHVKPTDV